MDTAPYGPYVVPDSSAFSTAFYTQPSQAKSAGAQNGSGGTGLSGMINKLFGGGLYGNAGNNNSLAQWGKQNLIDNIKSGQGGILQDNMENTPDALAAFDPARYWQVYGQDPGPISRQYWISQGNPNGVMQYYPAPGVTEVNLSAPNIDSWWTPTGFKNNLTQSIGNFERGYGFTASSDPAPTLYYPQNSWDNLIATASPPGVPIYGTAAYNPFNGMGGVDFGSGTFDTSGMGYSGGDYGYGDY